MIWRSPRCRRELGEIDDAVACDACGISHPCSEGILDLRTAGARWVGRQQVQAQVRQLIAETAGFSAEETVRYVFEYRSDLAHEFVRLLSVSEARRLIEVTIVVPEIPEMEIAHFPTYRKMLARLYNRLARWKMFNPLFRLIGPFFRSVGRKEIPLS